MSRLGWLGRQGGQAAAVAGLGLGLRLALALINRQANDNHLEVATRILATGKLPIKGECFECYQPKLYHLLLAGASAFSACTASRRA
jgi:hypothetical protein